MRLQVKLRLLFGGMIMVILLWLVILAIAPSGHIAYESDFNNGGYFIRRLTPPDRVRTGAAGAVIAGEPVYFSLRTLRRFDRAEIALEFENEGNWPLIEIGGLADKELKRYRLKPLSSALLNGLGGDWTEIREGEAVLWQRQPVYASIGDFLSALPPREKTLTYHYDLPENYAPDGYEAFTVNWSLPFGLRGHYAFYAYIENETLAFEMSIRDLNQNRDPDQVEAILTYMGEALKTEILPDDGKSADRGEAGGIRKLVLKVPDLPAGAYKIEVRANDDIVTTDLKTAQKLLSFTGRFRIVAPSGPLMLYTDANEIFLETTDPASLGPVQVGGETVALAETYRQYAAVSTATSTAVRLDAGDMIIAGDGVFSLKPEFVNPGWKKIRPGTSLDAVEYIIACYNPPAIKDGRLSARAVFDLASLYRENGEYGFLISVPGLRAEDGRSGVSLKKIKIDLSGASLWAKALKILKKD